MDKWKDSELEKMKVGGNRQCKEFFSSQPDFKESWSFQNKWNSRAAALYRDKVGRFEFDFDRLGCSRTFVVQVAALSRGEPWSVETSMARNRSEANVGESHSPSLKQSQSFAAKTHTNEDAIYNRCQFFEMVVFKRFIEKFVSRSFKENFSS